MSTYAHPELLVETMDIAAACAAAGMTVEERGNDSWWIECCGEPCSIGSGICGGDIVTCDSCGASVRNLASPHINHGLVSERLLSDGVYETCWYPKAAAPHGGDRRELNPRTPETSGSEPLRAPLGEAETHPSPPCDWSKDTA